MDLLRLDPTTNQPNDVVEGYESLIWTERYLPTGEFEMKSQLIGHKEVLPEGSLVTLRDTDEVMIVETHDIAADEDGVDILTIKGSTFESFLAERMWYVDSLTGDPTDEDVTGYPSEMARAAIGQILSVSYATPQAGNPVTDLVPNVGTSISFSYSGETVVVLERKPENLYEKVLKLLNMNGRGIRNVRPGPGSTTLAIDVFTGTDLTGAVIFRHDMGDIEKSSYLSTNKGYKNVAYVVAGPVPDSGADEPRFWIRQVYAPGVSSSISGLDRRVLMVEMSDINVYPSTSPINTKMDSKGLYELAQRKKSKLFDCQISSETRYKYNVDYKLGDIVSLMAEYDFNAYMQVSEYIRTEDAEGERGYPTLSYVDEIFVPTD